MAIFQQSKIIPIRTRVLFPAVLLLILCSAVMAKQPNVNDADQRAAERADELYAEEKFSRAYRTYLQLAKKGDPFSQYRVSYMNLHGQGVEQDVAKAFAWAVLAAETGDENLLKYFGEVKSLVPKSEQAVAQEEAAEYMQEWGKLALAREAHKKAKRIRKDCTGSRVGTRCDEVYAMQMPKFWSISPGVGGGADGGSGAPSGSVSSAVQGGGGESRDADYYRELRNYVAALEQYIQQEGGNVELGEFEVLEPNQENGQTTAQGSKDDSGKPR